MWKQKILEDVMKSGKEDKIQYQGLFDIQRVREITKPKQLQLICSLWSQI